MKKPTFNKQRLIDKVTSLIKLFIRYSFPIFLVFVGLIYVLVLFRINVLSDARPSDTAINSQVTAAAIPNVDQAVINQLQSLQDNSVSVKALFNQARSNPFQ